MTTAISLHQVGNPDNPSELQLVSPPSFAPIGHQTYANNQPQTLREYQSDCVLAIRMAWEERVGARRKRPLVSLATGSGKTTIFAQTLVETLTPATQRALLFAHSEEIINQMAERVRNQFGGLLNPWYGPTFAPGIGIVMGDQDAANARIVVATRQSLHSKRLDRVLANGAFDIVVIDEAHHSSAESYLGIVKAVQAANPNVKILGVTATPKRTDRKALGMVFDEIVYNWSIIDGIAHGFLTPATRKRVSTIVNVSDVRTVQGDYAQDKLVSVLDAQNWVDLAVDAYFENIHQDSDAERPTRPCLAFFPEVEMSRRFIGHLQERGIRSAHLDANTPKDIRRGMIRDYNRGALDCISNMGVLTEGADLPRTSAILMARPTRSETVYTQIIGRGLRLYPDKTDCLIVELAVIDAKPLLVGSLLGRQETCANSECGALYYFGLPACPVCGAAQPPPAPKEEEELGLPGMQSWLNQQARVDVGAGLRTEELSLFEALHAAWYQDDQEWRSTGVGFDKGCLVVAPPSYAGNAVRIRERLYKGSFLLGTIEDDWREELIEQMNQLQRELARIDHYTLWFVPDRSRTAEFIVGDSDLNAILARADIEALRRGGSDAAQQVRKDAGWRLREPSPGQLNMLAVLKAPAIPGANKGLVSSVINHYLAVPTVKRWIEYDILPDVLPEGTN